MPIRIIDRTMACLDGLSNGNPSSSRFRDLLFDIGVDVVEDVESQNLNNVNDNRNRIYGYDDALCGDYQKIFSQLRKKFGDDVEINFGNKFFCATALAVEWLMCGNGGSVVTSFAGIDGGAATEEVIIALHINNMRNKNATYNFLPEMTKLFCDITGKKISANKSIIGEKIFHVESGVHVDGILKHPACYEPFPPELVGQSRKIILGKQSGTSSIRAKLLEHNIVCNDELVKHILEQVKKTATEKNGIVTDREFIKIVKECV